MPAGGRLWPLRDFALPDIEDGAPPASYRLDAQPAPVLARGGPGEWDSLDVLNPAVVVRGGSYYNCYSGFDGKTWRTGLALSTDGLLWKKQGKVLSPDPSTWEGSYIAANGALLHDGREFLYWYQAGPKGAPHVGLARSADARSWRKNPTPVLDPGPRGTWDEVAVGDPYVIRRGEYYYMFYLGEDRARRQRLGVARSTDGLVWEKLRSNPILELGEFGSFDETGLGEPAVFVAHGRYWMLYTGRDRGEVRRLGLARSSNGVAWRKVPLVFDGPAPWSSKAMCDPEVHLQGSSIRIWFGGGDRASPDENLNGQIGAGALAAIAP